MVVARVIVLMGAALVTVGYLQHARISKLLKSDEAAQPRWPLTITTFAVIGAVLLSALIVVST
jgi:hypothetical protein